MNPDEIRAMIVKDLDLQALPPEMQEEVIEKFTQNALKRVTLAIYERLPEAGRAEFAQLGEKADSAGLMKLFQANIPDLDAFIRAEIQDELKQYKDFKNAE